jgi:stage V sporulation protein R
MSSRFFHGSPILLGSNTVPGVQIPPELKKVIPDIFKACDDFGLDYYPPIIQMLTHDEMSEIASYGGFPIRYPHWKWGMEYEEMQTGYMHGMHRIYEMIANTNPCLLYCLNSNTLLDNVTVIAHALGHSHFFKNNLFFQHTNKNMLNEFANHGTRIRRYMARWGKERVIEFLDHVLRIETLVDNAKAWNTREVKEPVIRDQRRYRHPRRMKVEKDHMYMDDWINTKSYIDREHERIEKAEKADDLGLFLTPDRDIFGWIKDNANLKPWQADIMAMLYEEAMYYSPQGMTKTINEGFASYCDYHLIAKQGLCGLGQEGHDFGIVEYAKHKMGVLGGKYSTNPYKLGFTLLLDIEERWDKGRFGDEYENCEDFKRKESWDLKLGQGKEKVFEVCRLYDDINLINEFFTQDFCDRNQFFDWEKNEAGEYVVLSKDAKQIKRKLIEKYTNRGLPDIRLADPNHLGRGIMLLEHNYAGRSLYQPYVQETMTSINFITNKPVLLVTKDKNGEEVVYYCEGFGDSQVHKLNRNQYRKEFGVTNDEK